MKNEKGSTLLLVLIISLVFMTLGLSILSSTIGGSKRSEIRGFEVSTTLQSKKIMDEIVAKIYQKISLKNEYGNGKLSDFEKPSQINPDYDSIIQGLMDEVVDEIQHEHGLGEGEFINSLEIMDIRNFPDGTTLMQSYVSSYNEAERVTYNNNYFTRVYRIKLVTKDTHNGGSTINRTLFKNFVLSPTPSFFQYATGTLGKERLDDGSDREIDGNALTINGSAEFIGNVFAPSVEVTKSAKYIFNTEDKIMQNQFPPSIYGTLFLNELNTNLDIPFYNGFYEEVSNGTVTGIPPIKPTGGDFVDMIFIDTYQKKEEETNTLQTAEQIVDPNNFNSEYLDALIALGYLDADDTIVEPDENDPQHDEYFYNLSIIRKKDGSPLICKDEVTASEDLSSCDSGFFLVENDWSKEPLINNGENPDVLYFTDIKTNNGVFNGINEDSTLVITEDLDLGEDGWLVVDGNLKIVANKDTPPKINGNILVEKDFEVRGYEDKASAEFDSTIFVKGNSLIYRTNIAGICNTGNCPADQKELVLISKGPITISRINELQPVPTENRLAERIQLPPSLKAFFYTEDEATLYGVGSFFDIEGGLFARKKLTINAFRGDITDIQTLETGSSTANQESNSRFYVEYAGNVLTNQLNALPRVDRLQMIVDDLIIK